MDASKNENSFDNRRAALVSRKGRAPRARAGRKSLIFNALGLTRARRTARGAQVSRAARGSNAPRNGARRAKSAYFVRGSLGNAKWYWMEKCMIRRPESR